MTRRALALLRSRRLAAWLIAALAAYLVAVTAVHVPRPYSNPTFLAAVVWLVLATGACAWERTRVALVPLARPQMWRESLARRAAEKPDTTLPGDLTTTAEDFSAMGLTVRQDDHAVFAYSRLWAYAASPLFHWALTLLFALAALGPLVRSEGTLYIVDGGSVIDRRSSYVRGVASGPLFGERFTGTSFFAEKIVAEHVVDGIARGASPLIVASRGGRVLSRAYVYPNSPMRVASLLVHRGAVGPAIQLRCEFPDGKAQTVDVPFDLDAEGRPLSASVGLRSGQTSATVGLAPATGGRLGVNLCGREVVIGLGESAELAGGVVVSLVARTSYAQLVVVNDPTLVPVYALLVLALVAAGVALFLPPRAAVALQEADGRLAFALSASALDTRLRVRLLGTAPTSGAEGGGW